MQEWGSQYGLHPVGAGPFTLQSQVVRQTATLARNPHYWQPGWPYLDSATWRVVAGADSALATVSSGGAQIVEGVRPPTRNGTC
ncbi:ABC transporter substrate-binding protein [Saccharopolyspora sp. NPDC050389]|uniref:ABC transporter substrate-binding protein n=1 Tax=Saccharopolyspora sp. NPDC050389 TaxID=3155516 RepID=UPI0033E696A4